MDKATARHTFFATLLVSVISVAGIALPYPILAPLFIQDSGSALTQFAGIDPKLLLAIALAIYPLGVLIGGSFIGALSDIFGRKYILSASLSLSVAGYVVMAWSIQMEHYPLFILSRLITGLCEGNIAICRALVLDCHPHIDKTKGMSINNAAIYSGYLVGPIVGGALMSFGADAAFWLAAVVCLVARFIVGVALPDDTINNATVTWRLLSEKIVSHNSLKLLQQKELLYIFSAYLLLAMGINTLYEYYPLFLTESFAADSWNIGLSTALLTLTMVLSSTLLVTRYKHWLGHKKGIVLAMICLASILISFYWASYDTARYIIAPAAGIFIALVNGLLPVYLSDRYQAVGQGRLMGLVSSTFFFANLMTAILGGLISLWHSVWILVFGGALIFISAAAMSQLVQKPPASH